MIDIEKFEIFYIRHANTDNASFSDRCRCDIDLSDLGEKQAELLGKRFYGCEFDAVISSPLVRCVKTAAALCNGLSLDNCPVEIMPELIENGCMKDYDGVDIEYLKRYYDNIKLCPDIIYGDENRRFENDTDELNDERAEKIIEYLKNRFGYGKKIAVICHGSFGNHFIPAALGIKSQNWIFSINNTSVSKIKYTSDGKVRLSFMNDFSHLRVLDEKYEFNV